MANDREVSYKVTTDTKGAGTGLDKLSKKTKETDTNMIDLRKTMVGAAAAVTAITGTVLGLVATYRVQEQAEIKLSQTLKATGFAAGLSANELTKMASSLQEVTTFGDEAIIGAQTMLLTFKQIGKDVFPQATEAVLDMAEAMGTSLQGSAIQLGKALNDPIAGVAALSRVGVQFNGVQKEQIRTFVESGEIAKAQAVILKELEGQFGGVARAAAGGTGALIQTKNILGDIGESGGKILLPFVLKLNEALKESATFWNGVASAIATQPTDKTREEITQLEAKLKDLEKTYLEAQKGGQALISTGFLGFRAGKAAAQEALEQWTETSERITVLRAQLSEAEKKEFAGSVEAQKAANAEKEAEDRRFKQALADLGAEFRLLDEEQFNTDLDRINNQLTTIEKAETESNARKIREEQGTAAAIADINKKTLILRKKNSEDTVKSKEQEARELLALQTEFFANATSLANSENKTLAAIGKAAALTDLAIKTPQAVANAYTFGLKTGGGPILATILAGIAAAAMGAQAAKIAGVKLAEGGLVEGPASFGKVDKIPAMLQAGELVAPRQNFDEVVEAVARQRGFTRQDNAQQTQNVDVKIGFTDNAFELIETKLLQRQALGV